jgi:hypothetical protein
VSTAVRLAMMFRVALCFIALVSSANAGSVPSLTEATFEDQVFNSGKNAFIKFFAPW